MKKAIGCAVVALALLSINGYGQDCTQQLRNARSLYDQGRLHELPGILAHCLNSGFSQSEKVEAYKLLIQTYIYLEEPDSADLQMINLLNTDHFFQVNEALDPVEFKNLYQKFRHDPVFRYGLRVGPNFDHVSVLKNHYIFGNSMGKGRYQTHAGIQFGLLFEKDLKYLKNKLTFNPELFYSSYSFTYLNNDPLAVDQTQEGKLEHDLSQTKVQANLLLQYKIEDEITLADKFTPYVAIGPAVSYLLTSSFDGLTNVGSEITGSTIDTHVNYKPIIVSVLATAGIKFRVGEVYITGDVRFQYGLMNVVNEKKRFRWDGNTKEQLHFGYVDNDYTISQSMFNIGIIVPRFNPIKNIR